MKKKVFIYATEHADLVWRRCFDRDFTFKGENFVSYSDLEGYFIIDNIKLCEENAEYKFTIESVAMLKKFLEKNPEYEGKVKELFKKGQIQMPFSGNNIVDSNMVNGESIIRNFLYGREYLKEKYNYVPYGMDRSDAFGNSAQLPQIARKFGTKWIFNLTYSVSDNLYWRGLDGSTVLTWMPNGVGYTGGYYKYRPCPKCDGFREKDCPVCKNRRIDTEFMENMRVKLPDTLDDFDDTIPGRIYCGGEEILPNSYIIEWAKKHADKYDIKFANYDDYIPYIKDLLDNADNTEEIHSSSEINCNNTGTFVTRIDTKKTVRENENRLLSAETLAVSDMLKGAEYPKEEIEKIWDKFFFTIFHDSIPATHVDAANAEIMDCAREIKESANALKNKILSANTVKNDEVITVYNPYGSTVTSEVTAVLPLGSSVENVSVTAYETDDNSVKITFISDVPAFSKKTYKIIKSDKPYTKNVAKLYELNEFNGMPILTNEVSNDKTVEAETETVIENDSFKITASENGIKQIFDKKLGKVITEQSEYMVGEWILEHDEGSAWATHSPDMRRQRMNECTHLSEIEKTDDYEKLTFIVRPGDIDGNAVMGLKITYSVTLKNKNDRVDFSADVFWHTQNYRLRIAMPVKGEAKHLYDIPYGVIERKPYEHNIVFPNGATNWASAAGDYPAIHWAGIQKEDYSLALFNRGTPSYQINTDANGNTNIYLSVLRSPSIGSYLYSPTEYTMTDYDGMRDCGNHHFEYSLKAYANGFDENNAVLDGVAYNAKLAVVNGELDVSELPVLLCEDARISSIKISQDKKGIIVRINEYHGKDTKGTLVIPDSIKAKSVYEVDLKEEKIKELIASEGKVSLEIVHYEIKTVYIEL